MTGSSMDSGSTNDPVKIVANIFISFIGAGVLGLPYAFKESGLLEGGIVMSVVCYFSIKAMLLLIDCKYKISPNSSLINKKVSSNGKEYVELKLHETDDSDEDDGVEKNDNNNHTVKHKGEITYSDVGYAAYGQTGRYIIDTTLLISQVGFCCAYLIFIAENMATFFSFVSKTQWLVLSLPPLFFLTLVPDLGKLAIFSLFAQISNLFAFAVVFWFDFDHLHLARNEHRKEFSIKGFPFFFSVAIYCFEGAGMILSLEQSVGETYRPAFKKIFVRTIVAVTFLYISFGTSGYLSYGPDTQDIITLNLPPSNNGLDFAVMVKSCLCFSLFLTYPIMLFPVTALLEKRLHLHNNGLYCKILRLGLVTLTGLIVVVIPRFPDLMSLVGATCCTLLAFIMPAMCHLALFKKEINREDVILDYILVGMGIVGAILGTWDSVKNIVD